MLSDDTDDQVRNKCKNEVLDTHAADAQDLVSWGPLVYRLLKNPCIVNQKKRNRIVGQY
jgi:hypothetical protein